MPYYHCSPIAGLTQLQPGRPKSFDKPARVYMTTLLPMALMYCVQNYEYTYGYTKEGHIYLDEYFPNELEILYKGKSASLYICAPESTESTRIPNEAVSEAAVPVIEEIHIPDAMEALLEQERLGNLVINKYDMKPYFDFDDVRVETNATDLNPNLKVFRLSARSGEGTDAFMDWIAGRIAERIS